MTLYFTADTHYNHPGIIRHSERPWDDVIEMNDALVDAWNAKVGPKDTVWHLGDFGFVNARYQDLQGIYNRLNGHKHLVYGNHDESNRIVLLLGWESVQPLAWIKHDGHRIMACHYAMSVWKNSHHGALMLHGHSHGTLQERRPNRMDVGVDTRTDFAPIALETILEELSEDVYQPVDHHGSVSAPKHSSTIASSQS